MLGTETTYEIHHKLLEPLIVASVLMKAPYEQCGVGFALIGQTLGRHIAGIPFCLHHGPPKPDGTGDFDTCIPIREEVEAPEGITIKRLSGGPCIYTTHLGAYDEIGNAYQAMSTYLESQGLHLAGGPREVYIKGPRLFIPRSPKHFVTEIQFPIES